MVVALPEIRERRARGMEGYVGAILVSLELIRKRRRGRRTGGGGGSTNRNEMKGEVSRREAGG